MNGGSWRWGAIYFDENTLSEPLYSPFFVCVHFLLNLIHLGNIINLKIYSIDIERNVKCLSDESFTFFFEHTFKLHWMRVESSHTNLSICFFFGNLPLPFYQSDAYLFSIFCVAFISQQKHVNKWKHFSDDLWNYFNE